MSKLSNELHRLEKSLQTILNGTFTTEDLGKYKDWNNLKRIVWKIYKIKEFLDDPIKYSNDTIAARQGYVSGGHMDNNVGNSKLKSNWRNK